MSNSVCLSEGATVTKGAGLTYRGRGLPIAQLAKDSLQFIVLLLLLCERCLCPGLNHPPLPQEPGNVRRARVLEIHEKNSSVLSFRSSFRDTFMLYIYHILHPKRSN